MSLHLTRTGAQEAATERLIEANKISATPGRTSAHRFRSFAVRRKFLILWEDYEKVAR